MTADRYSGRRAVLPTLHGKGIAVAPSFASVLGLQVESWSLNTDEFGTFSGETPRVGSPLDTARAKARAGIALSGSPLAIASEGSIGPDPRFPFSTVDAEVLLFIDEELGIEVHETHLSLATKSVRSVVSSGQDLSAIMSRAGLPEHGLIVLAEGGAVIAKGLRSEAELAAAVKRAIELSPVGQAVIQSDFRAHMSPSRMQAIAECAERLALRIAELCPACSTPGWGKTEPLWGLPCADCEALIPHLVRADRMGCVKCPEVREQPRPSEFGDPQWCLNCNP